MNKYGMIQGVRESIINVILLVVVGLIYLTISLLNIPKNSIITFIVLLAAIVLIVILYSIFIGIGRSFVTSASYELAKSEARNGFFGVLSLSGRREFGTIGIIKAGLFAILGCIVYPIALYFFIQHIRGKNTLTISDIESEQNKQQNEMQQNEYDITKYTPTKKWMISKSFTFEKVYFHTKREAYDYACENRINIGKIVSC